MRIVAINGKRFDKVDLRLATTTNLVHLSGTKSTITYIDDNGQEHTTTIKRR